MATDASELFTQMSRAVHYFANKRQSLTLGSPNHAETVEASPFQAFVLTNCLQNIPGQRSTHIHWAAANTLHFFYGSEDAKCLLRYNRLAERFAPNGHWDGAYGAIAMPQLRDCVDILTADPLSRRAIVTMGQAVPLTINRPACWNTLQFLRVGHRLHMGCFQRSLHLQNVMPYDCVLLTNILNWTAWKLKLACGELHWTVGSLHTSLTAEERNRNDANQCILPPDVLDDPMECKQWLYHPESAQLLWAEILCGGLTT